MRRRTSSYLVAWDKPRRRSAPGRFYCEMKREFGDKVEFLQRSVYGTGDFEVAKRLASLARRYGLKVRVFLVAEVS
jgi:hypothetical protein